MTDYNQILEGFRCEAKSMSDRELLEEIYAKLHFVAYMQAELEKVKVEHDFPNTPPTTHVNFPDTRFCQVVNPIPFDKIK